MKIYKSNCFDVRRIDFCCSDMAKDVLFGVVKTDHWTDHPLMFYVSRDLPGEKYYLTNCGHCGAKIEGELFNGDD